MDGIKIFANIDGLGGLNAAISNNADGIGLLRSEFLYLDAESFPTEEMQFSTYRNLLFAMAGKPVIIRTLDLGADKNIAFSEPLNEKNPALGLRGIRLCLAKPEIFKVQLRALYRASVYGNLSIMFPMITSKNEIYEIKKISEIVKSDLKSRAVPYSKNLETGIMIETPASALLSDELSKMTDFFSIGTNDLEQFTLAYDRENAKSPFFDKDHNAVLKLIEMTAKNAHAAGIRVGICGELAADASLSETFIKMGIDYLSVSSQKIPMIRDIVRKTRI